jgi:hypothetical protein
MSKGSWYRKVNKKKFDENYDRIFGGSKDVGDDGCDDRGSESETEGEGETESEPFISTNPILRCIEADHRRG